MPERKQQLHNKENFNIAISWYWLVLIYMLCNRAHYKYTKFEFDKFVVGIQGPIRANSNFVNNMYCRPADAYII